MFPKPKIVDFDLRNKFQKKTCEEIKNIIDQSYPEKSRNDVSVVDISGNDLGTNITIEDFNEVLGHIDKTFPKLNKFVSNENNLYKWFKSKNIVANDSFSGFNLMPPVKSLDLSQNSLFFCGLPYETLLIILKSLPKELETLDLTQYPCHPTTNEDYKYTDKELINIVSIVEERCKSLKKMFFDEELEKSLGLDGTFKALKKFVIQLQQKKQEKQEIKKFGSTI